MVTMAYEHEKEQARRAKMNEEGEKMAGTNTGDLLDSTPQDNSLEPTPAHAGLTAGSLQEAVASLGLFDSVGVTDDGDNYGVECILSRLPGFVMSHPVRGDYEVPKELDVSNAVEKVLHRVYIDMVCFAIHGFPDRDDVQIGLDYAGS